MDDSLPNFISTKVLESLVHKQIIQILKYDELRLAAEIAIS